MLTHEHEQIFISLLEHKNKLPEQTKPKAHEVACGMTTSGEVSINENAGKEQSSWIRLGEQHGGHRFTLQTMQMIRSGQDSGTNHI